MPAIGVEFADGEIDGSIALVGEPVGDDLLDVIHDFRHVFRHACEDIGRSDVEAMHVVVEFLFPVSRKLAKDGIVFDLKNGDDRRCVNLRNSKAFLECKWKLRTGINKVVRSGNKEIPPEIQIERLAIP